MPRRRMRGRGPGVSPVNSLQRIRTADRNLYEVNRLSSAPLPLQKPGQLSGQGGGGMRKMRRRRQKGGAAIVDKYGAYLPVPVNL